MFTILGVLALILGSVWIILHYAIPNTITRATRKYDKSDGKYYDKITETDNEQKPNFLNSPKKGYILLVLAVILFAINGTWFINPPGTATSIQYLWGGDQMVATQGLKFKWWGRTIPISFEIAMQDVLEQDGVTEEEGIYYRQAQRREFADAIKADIASSLIVSVDYGDSDKFLDMADKNRSEEKLVYARVYPVYDQALKNTCKLMDAQDYISGAASQFDYYLKDQMENGMYLTEEIYVDVDEMEITAGDSTRTVAKGKIDKQKREKKYKIKEDANGEIVRDASNSLKRYGLTVQQAAVTNIDWEESFDTRLQLQKEQVAQTQLEKQEAEKEYYATQKAIAKGEREKAEVRVTYEKLQLESTIAAETRAKEAKYKEEEEANLLAAAKKAAQTIRVTADAEAYEIMKKVNVGITPEVRLEMELNAKIAIMGELAKTKFPQYYFVGEGKGNSPLEALIISNMAKGLQK